jgi:hypothetical protein
MWGKIISQLVRQCKRNTPRDSEDIEVYQGEDGFTMRLREPVASGPSASPSASGSSDDFPFQVVQKDDTTLTLLGYNESAGRYWTNKIVLGLTTITVAEQDKTVAGAGQLYLDTTYSGSAYAVALTIGTMPAQSDTHMYFELGVVGFASSKITYYQQTWTGGQIHMPGRLFQ